MSDKYAALKQAAEKAQLESKDEWGYDTDAFHDGSTPESIIELLAERDADRARITELQYELGRYSMSAGEADQRRCESRAARDALGFGKDADDVSPSDLRQRIAELEVRTLTVKLPQRQECEGYHIDEAYLTPADDGDCYYRDDVIESIKEACAAAGISLKIEGE